MNLFKKKKRLHTELSKGILKVRSPLMLPKKELIRYLKLRENDMRDIKL